LSPSFMRPELGGDYSVRRWRLFRAPVDGAILAPP
jgi:hypothetical protein